MLLTGKCKVAWPRNVHIVIADLISAPVYIPVTVFLRRQAGPRPDAVPGRHCPDLFRSTCSSAEGTRRRLRENCRGVWGGWGEVGGLKSKQRNLDKDLDHPRRHSSGPCVFYFPMADGQQDQLQWEVSKQLFFSCAWMAMKPRRELWLVRGHILHFTGKPWEEYWESETTLLLKSVSQPAGMVQWLMSTQEPWGHSCDSGQGTCPG